MATQSTPLVDSMNPDAFVRIGTNTGRWQSATPNFTEVDKRPPRICTVCSEAIPAARLKAKPGATHCVPCLEKSGDVPRLRRFDETSAQGTVETLFTSDVNLSRQLDRQRQTVPGYRAENAEPSFYEEYFTSAVQDADVTAGPNEAEALEYVAETER